MCTYMDTPFLLKVCTEHDTNFLFQLLSFEAAALKAVGKQFQQFTGFARAARAA
jgi:hypothetical protein